MLKSGDVAPAFHVSDHLGNEVSLDKLRGKTVVLWFFPKADTPGWTIEGCGFRDLKADFDRKNAVVLGVSFDTPAENRAFAEKFHFNYPLLCNVNRTVGVAYGAAASATATNAQRIGVVIGPDGKIQEWSSKVDPKTYPQEVLKRMGASGGGWQPGEPEGPWRGVRWGSGSLHSGPSLSSAWAVRPRFL
jgi:peroxiredoxin Q/BCP